MSSSKDRITKTIYMALILITVFVCHPQTFYAQVKFKGEPDIHESLEEKDRNHGFEGCTDITINSVLDACYTLDGEYVGPFPLGIDQYAVEVTNATNVAPGLKLPFWVRGIGAERDSLYVDMIPHQEGGREYFIGGHDVSFFVNYRSLKGKVELMTLDEIRRKYCPKEEEPVVFMINKFFIMRQPDLYKVDKDFIYKVEVVHSKDFDVLKDMGAFTIIRIFTRTHHNWHQSTLGT